MIPVDSIAHQVGNGFPTQRVRRVIGKAVEKYRLDLSSLVVLTEAATGYYRVTPVIAAHSGAKRVIAVARDTDFGTAERAIEQVMDLARAMHVDAIIEPVTVPALDVAHRAQVITNLGAVRPIDSDFVQRLSTDAVVSLMFGARDARPADIHISALRRVGIPLCGVDEAGIDLFRWTGQRIAWWLTEVGLEIVGARIMIWGDDVPAHRTSEWLSDAGAKVSRIPGDDTPKRPDLELLDALVLMDEQAIVAPGGNLTPELLATSAPGAVVLEYRGYIERERCHSLGVLVFPTKPPINGHVARTIGEILYAPVIELHTAGLRVGEIMARARRQGLDFETCEHRACEQGPGEMLRTTSG